MKKYKFKAKIEAGDGGGSYVLFPYDVEKEFGAKGRVPVSATFDGVPYTGSLMKYGSPMHMLGILKEIREQIGKGPGDIVEVEVWKDENPRSIEVPAEFQAAMKKAGVASFFGGLSYTHRKEYVRWISEAKKEATRSARVENAIEMLKKGAKTPDQRNSIGRQR
ncbi:MAG TPA: YdeI/OmpD-associated family protein [Bryobacteraceae bacterium]|jgi:bifunctional DNA-binding transcriptional regulator/antitoxin component of YhaV-PrlF toxin-antitoxin module|nr:YdeI/OmpD-associated family protein [Bryobacteraceae bacterium]